jgi:phosphoribosylanthranilate isomerase
LKKSDVKIKICGLTRCAEAEMLNREKVDYAGFVFASSRRQLLIPQAAEIRQALDPGIQAVGVFVDQASEFILQTVRYVRLDVIQLHGNERQADIDAIRKLTGKPVIKAISVKAAEDLNPEYWPDAEFILLDHGKGGTGKAFDWSLLERARHSRPFFLAGGLTPENVASAMGYRPYAVDVSSGVETAGIKDREKIAAFVQNVRNHLF